MRHEREGLLVVAFLVEPVALWLIADRFRKNQEVVLRSSVLWPALWTLPLIIGNLTFGLLALIVG